MHPRISVVVSVGSQRQFLPDAVKSLESQTFGDFEVLFEPGRSIAEARNKGLQNARGDYIAILDSDDISYPERLKEEMGFLDQHPSVSVVGSWADRFGDRKGTIRTPENVTIGSLFMWNRVVHSSVLYRKGAVLPFGYRPDVVYEDWDLWIRLAKAGHRIANIQKPLVAVRFSPEAHTWKVPTLERWVAQVDGRASCF